MDAFLASVISVTAVNGLGLFGTLWGLRIKDKFNSNKFLVTLLIVSIAFLGFSYLTAYVVNLSDGLSIIASIVSFLVITYLSAKYYLKFDEKLSRKFAVYYTVIATFLGIVIGTILSVVFLSIFTKVI